MDFVEMYWNGDELLVRSTSHWLSRIYSEALDKFGLSEDELEYGRVSDSVYQEYRDFYDENLSDATSVEELFIGNNVYTSTAELLDAWEEY